MVAEVCTKHTASNQTQIKQTNFLKKKRRKLCKNKKTRAAIVLSTVNNLNSAANTLFAIKYFDLRAPI